jgi:hypothetical protein
MLLFNRGQFDGFHEAHASVSKIYLVRFDNNRYSVNASTIPGGLSAQWQVVHLKGELTEQFLTVHLYMQYQLPIHIAAAGLAAGPERTLRLARTLSRA